MSDRIREVDANLLLFLHALLEDRNLTHAGNRMSMSQPAMSGALTRLRKHFDDELLVRDGREFLLTPLAERLRPEVAAAVLAAEALLGSHRRFDPEQSSRRFTLTMSEYAVTVLGGPLSRTLRQVAPDCHLDIESMPRKYDELESALMRRDLIIGPTYFDLPGKAQPVFSDHLVCLVARENPRLRDGALSIEDLQEMPSALARFEARGTKKRPLEAMAAEHGLADRNVAVRVTSLLTLPFAIAGTGLYSFVPSRLAYRVLDRLDLVVATTPLPTVRITEAAHWHPRRDAEPAIRWLRELLYDIAIDLENEADGGA